MLFNRCQRTASADGLEWGGKKWSLVNHFIPFTETDVNSFGRFESDFMVRHLAAKKISQESKAVLREGKHLWKAFFAHTDVRSVREEYKLNRPDVGWYQVRRVLEVRNSSGSYPPVSFKPFERVYQNLTEKLQVQLYQLGFVRT